MVGLSWNLVLGLPQTILTFPWSISFSHTSQFVPILWLISYYVIYSWLQCFVFASWVVVIVVVVVVGVGVGVGVVGVGVAVAVAE